VTVVTLALAGAVVLLLPIGWRIATSRFDPFEPIVLFSIAWGVMFVVRPIALIDQGNTMYFGLDIGPTLPRAVLVALLGAVCFVWAYESSAGTALARRLPAPAEVGTKRTLIAAAVVGAVGLSALLVVLPTSDLNASLQILLGGRSDTLAVVLDETPLYLWYGSWLLVPAALVFAAIALRERSALIGVGALVVSSLALLRLVPLGNRAVLLPFLGALLVFLHVSRNRRPGAVSLVLAAAVALLASFVVLSVRDPETRSVEAVTEQLLETPQVVFRPVVRGPDAEMVQAFSAALTVIPDELSYRYGGATVGTLLIRPIPRQLWTGKPATPGKEVVGAVWPQFVRYLDPAFSPLLPLYWDFGLPGVAAGMGLFGLVARALYEWFKRHRRELVAQLVFSLGVWFVVIGVRNAPVDTVVLLCFLLLPVILVAGLGRSGADQTRVAAAHRPESRPDQRLPAEP
jgi:hypothetical protein